MCIVYYFFMTKISMMLGALAQELKQSWTITKLLNNNYLCVIKIITIYLCNMFVIQPTMYFNFSLNSVKSISIYNELFRDLFQCHCLLGSFLNSHKDLWEWTLTYSFYNFEIRFLPLRFLIRHKIIIILLHKEIF